MATGVAPVRRCTRAGVPAGTRLRRDLCAGRQIRRAARGRPSLHRDPDRRAAAVPKRTAPDLV